jgi:hypothetical protein
MTARTLRTSDPKRALAGLRVGKRVQLYVPRDQADQVRALFAEKLPAAVVARLNVRGSEVPERSGCLVLRTTRKGIHVGLYRSREAGIESDPEYPYTTVCEDHNTCVCHETRRSAEQCLSHPEMWCDDCREARPGR